MWFRNPYNFCWHLDHPTNSDKAVCGQVKKYELIRCHIPKDRQQVCEECYRSKHNTHKFCPANKKPFAVICQLTVNQDYHIRWFELEDTSMVCGIYERDGNTLTAKYKDTTWDSFSCPSQEGLYLVYQDGEVTIRRFQPKMGWIPIHVPEPDKWRPLPKPPQYPPRP